MITEPSTFALIARRRKEHPACLCCSDETDRGLHLNFQASQCGVETRFDCRETFQGYPDRLHGGVLSMLLDAAMTNCLFSYGVSAVTTKLTVRFVRPVRLNGYAIVRASLTEAREPSFRMFAEILQDDQRVATANALFVTKEAADALNHQF